MLDAIAVELVNVAAAAVAVALLEIVAVLANVTLVTVPVVPAEIVIELVDGIIDVTVAPLGTLVPLTNMPTLIFAMSVRDSGPR